MSDSTRRDAKESWLACALPALSDESFEEVHALVEAKLRADVSARVTAERDPRDVVGDGMGGKA